MLFLALPFEGFLCMLLLNLTLFKIPAGVLAFLLCFSQILVFSSSGLEQRVLALCVSVLTTLYFTVML